jgi:hypothetical protein
MLSSSYAPACSMSREYVSHASPVVPLRDPMIGISTAIPRTSGVLRVFVDRKRVIAQVRKMLRILTTADQPDHVTDAASTRECHLFEE